MTSPPAGRSTSTLTTPRSPPAARWCTATACPGGRPAGPIRPRPPAGDRPAGRRPGPAPDAPGEPELPVADVSARDTILATNDPDAPLFRVDGQGDLDQLHDRIHWEGRSVAYHQINVHRRDQTAQPGALPARFNRDSWEFAVGLREESPIHGDLKFQVEWDADRPAWTLRLDDIRLKPGSPAAEAGAGSGHPAPAQPAAKPLSPAPAPATLSAWRLERDGFDAPKRLSSRGSLAQPR